MMGDGKIPPEIIAAVEAELRGLAFGLVRLDIILHDGQPRYKISREKSIVPGKPASGSTQGGRQQWT
jgi:hypothetical protein